MHHLINEYNFQDWQTITVLVRVGSAQLNEYISGTIVDLPQQGHLTVVPSASAHPHSQSGPIRINLFENLFGILSDNAPPIRELTEGKHVLCRRHRTDPVTNVKYHLYQSGSIVQRTTDAKFHVMCDDQTEVLCLPRQSIRLFLPPWHDGQCRITDLSLPHLSSLSLHRDSSRLEQCARYLRPIPIVEHI